MGGSFDGYQVLYSDGPPSDPIRLGQLLVDLSEAAPADMLKYCSSLSPLTYTSFSSLVPVGANPTATIGLTAVNGSAATFMRSDAAPALSQSIAPTWTGLHTFNRSSTDVVELGAAARSTAVNLVLNTAAGIQRQISFRTGGVNRWIAQTDAVAESGSNAGSNFQLLARTDAGAALLTVLEVTRSNGAATWLGSGNFLLGADNKELRFGTGGDDMALYHDGTNSYIDGNTGHLIMRGNGSSSLIFRDGSDVAQLLVNTSGVRIIALDTNSANVVRSGTYTPTLTNTTNVAASTAHTMFWLRVGNTVTVAGEVEVDPTASASSTLLGISLPIASAFTDPDQLAGVGSDDQLFATGIGTWRLEADSTNDRASLANPSVSGSGNRSVFVHFSYRVI